MTERPLPQPWGEYELDEEREREIEIGPLTLRVRFTGNEVWLSHESEDEEQGTETRPGDGNEFEWSRWAVPEGARALRLTPVFPDRPIVARPEHAFHLVRGAKVGIYVRVPLRVRVELPEPDAVTLVEIPTHTLSDTWFGDFMDGELMYYLPTTARRRVRPEHFEAHLAVCPVRLSNASTDDLSVEKIAFRVAHLSLFARERELWADETIVRYRSAEEGSDIQMSGRPPPEAPDAELVSPPREPTVRGFRARTFARLMGLPGFGGAP